MICLANATKKMRAGSVPPPWAGGPRVRPNFLIERAGTLHRRAKGYAELLLDGATGSSPFGYRDEPCIRRKLAAA
jgi:hypothetical protein